MSTPVTLRAGALALAILVPWMLGGRRRGPTPQNVPFTATLTISVKHPPTLVNPPDITFMDSDGNTGVAQFWSPRRLRLPASAISGTDMTTMITVAGGQPLQSATIAGKNAQGDFNVGQGANGGFGGAMRLLYDLVATVRIGFAVATHTIDISVVGTSAMASESTVITFRNGIGQTWMQNTYVSLTGRRWTAGMVTATAMHEGETATAMATGYDNRTTAMGHGTLQLVTPFVIKTGLTQQQPGVAILRLVLGQQQSSAPWVLGGGALGLGLFGARLRWRRGS